MTAEEWLEISSGILPEEQEGDVDLKQVQLIYKALGLESQVKTCSAQQLSAIYVSLLVHMFSGHPPQLLPPTGDLEGPISESDPGKMRSVVVPKATRIPCSRAVGNLETIGNRKSSDSDKPCEFTS